MRAPYADARTEVNESLMLERRRSALALRRNTQCDSPVNVGKGAKGNRAAPAFLGALRNGQIRSARASRAGRDHPRAPALARFAAHLGGWTGTRASARRALRGRMRGQERTHDSPAAAFSLRLLHASKPEEWSGRMPLITTRSHSRSRPPASTSARPTDEAEVSASALARIPLDPPRTSTRPNTRDRL